MLKVQHELNKKLFLDPSKIQAVMIASNIFTFILNGFNFSCMEIDMPDELKEYCKKEGLL